MSKKQFLKRYHLIINRLRKNPASFEEIASHLKKESALDDENYDISIRTFQRDIKEIGSIYNIDIRYNRSQNIYEIEQDENDDRIERLIESFELFSALNLTTQYANHLIPEKRKPLGTDNMFGLLHAIKNQLEVQFVHEKYWESDEEKTNRKVSPIALKEARNRWYLVAKDSGDSKVKTFGLERMSALIILGQKAEEHHFDVEQHFKHSFGIICDDESKPKKILLSFTPYEAKYIKSMPLHSSQQIITDTEKETIFELFLHPTYDFVMELLSYGKEVTVLEPESLKTEMKTKLFEALQKYE